MDPLELLPSELWREIFDKVEDAQDWLNLYRASSTFEGVVGDQRTRALLSEVFHLPLVQKYLGEDLSGLLRLRLVSTHWKKAVDKTFEPPVCTSDYDLEGEEKGCNFRKIRLKYKFENTRTISKFLDKFGTHPGNPFIGSFAKFCFHLGKPIMESVGRLMDRFGTHIRRLYISGFSGTNPRLYIFVDGVRSCVELAPNLEELYVKFIALPGTVLRLRNPNFGNQMNLNPVPVVPKLKLLFFEGLNLSEQQEDCMVDLQNLLVRLCCSNPATLKTTWMFGVPAELPRLPNLKTALVKVIRAEDVSNLTNSSWSLTGLGLRPLGSTNTIPLDAAVVESIESFKESLTWLAIAGRWATSEEPNLKLTPPDLPRLQFLDIPPQLMSCQLWKNLPSLKRLRIAMYERVPDLNLIMECFDLLETQISEYKIWEILPKLRKIEMTGLQQVGNVRKRIRRVYDRRNRDEFRVGK